MKLHQKVNCSFIFYLFFSFYLISISFLCIYTAEISSINKNLTQEIRKTNSKSDSTPSTTTKDNSDLIKNLELFKSKIQAMKDTISSKLYIDGFNEEIMKNNILLTNTLSSNKIPIFIISFISISLMLLIVVVKLGKNKKGTSENRNINSTYSTSNTHSQSSKANSMQDQGMIFIKDSIYSEQSSFNEYAQFELKGRKVKSPYAIQLENIKFESKYAPINSKISSSNNHYNFTSNVKEPKKNVDFSFCNDINNYIFGKNNLNDTVDYDEREDLTSIINFLK